MKRKMLSVLLALMFCLGLAAPVFAAGQAPGEQTTVLDDADLLSSREEAELGEKLLEISRMYNAQIVVATMDTVPGGNVDVYVERLYDSMGFGYGDRHDGVLLLVCMDSREYRILSNGFAADAITGYEIDAIGDAIVSDLSDGNYARAFDGFAQECAYYLEGYLNGFPFDFGGNLLIAVAIGAVAGIVTAFVLKGQLKSVRRQNQANVYVKPGSMSVTVRRDLFLYRNVVRTKKETSSSSGSRSGSSRNVGGGSF